MRVYYNPKLKELARSLRNNSTLSEVLLWNHLKGKQMKGYDFHRQKPIDNYIVDFLCPKLRLIIEIDGESHLFKCEEDENRKKRLKSLGFHILRFDDLDVKKNIEGVLLAIEKWIEEYEHTAEHTPKSPLERGGREADGVCKGEYLVYSIAWFSTGRDKAARDLLVTAYENMKSGFIPADIEYVFCNRNPGEDTESDQFLYLAQNLGIETVALSSRDFLPEVRKQSVARWRSLYHQAVMERITGFQNKLIMLAGYMLIVSPQMCQKHTIINLHPAAPGGPAGTWQEVIWKLMDQRAGETGVMIHMVTETLDEGPPITYCTFPIRGKGFDPLWDELQGRLKSQSLQQLIAKERESNKLFQMIRREGVRREVPLIVLTLKAIAGRKVEISRKKAFAPHCLNKEIEAYLHLI